MHVRCILHRCFRSRPTCDDRDYTCSFGSSNTLTWLLKPTSWSAFRHGPCRPLEGHWVRDFARCGNRNVSREPSKLWAARYRAYSNTHHRPRLLQNCSIGVAMKHWILNRIYACTYSRGARASNHLLASLEQVVDQDTALERSRPGCSDSQQLSFKYLYEELMTSTLCCPDQYRAISEKLVENRAQGSVLMSSALGERVARSGLRRVAGLRGHPRVPLYLAGWRRSSNVLGLAALVQQSSRLRRFTGSR